MVRAILRLIAVVLATVGVFIFGFAFILFSDAYRSEHLVGSAVVFAMGFFFLGLAAWLWTLKQD
jgi:multisubunit Na+/H+ antiporter MnhG subunit